MDDGTEPRLTIGFLAQQILVTRSAERSPFWEAAVTADLEENLMTILFPELCDVRGER
jgi:hypothetical protein